MVRIYSEEDDEGPKIDKETVLNFFEVRARKAKILGPTQAVIYQDKAPALAKARDEAEKNLLYPLIDISKEHRVLDAGCGTGRWVKEIAPNCASYHGVDASPGLINIAKELYDQLLNVNFSVCSTENLTLNAIGENKPFDRIISFGVYIYLNDADVEASLSRLAKMAKKEARILFREPIGIGRKLTIKEHFSDELEQEYSAIYRTERELHDLFRKFLFPEGFKLIESGDVYKDNNLNNREDTKQRFFVLVR